MQPFNWRRGLVAAIAAGVLGGLVGIPLVLDAGGGSAPAPTSPTPAPDSTHPAPYKKGRGAQRAQPDPLRAGFVPGDFAAGSMRGPDDQPVGSGAPAGGRLAPWPGCGRHPVPSFSARTAPVRAIELHYTVSRNVTGRADMNALTGYASDPSNGASWHFLIDAEGHCYYSVPVSAKAWTIAGLNSQTVNIEVVSMGDERWYYAGGGPGFAKVRRVVRRIAQLYSIPLRHALTDGHCNVTRTGIGTHWEGGPCSGGHSDIKPWLIRRVVKRIAAG
jgi:hypothetical protein